MNRKEKGILQIYTGLGKGKTTAALGLALRAHGHGFKVHMIQFMKGGWQYGELEAAKNLPNFTIEQFGRSDFVDKREPNVEDVKLAKTALERTKEVMEKGEYDVIILDEVNVALEWGLIDLESVLEIIGRKPEDLELVLTGRFAPRELIREADLVTEMIMIKHPYPEGGARIGIDY